MGFTQPVPVPSIRTVRGFSLIELLVTIAIIAVLIGILLPSLKAARDAARSSLCGANTSQIGIAMAAYAGDNRDRIWESGAINPYRFWHSQPQNPRMPVSDTNPAVIGPALQYVTDAKSVFQCPTQRRRAETNRRPDLGQAPWNGPTYAPQKILWDMDPSDRDINFDYTMVSGVGGARIGCVTMVAIDKRENGGNAAPPTNAELQTLRSIPIYMEEDEKLYNGPFPDGMFCNNDQLTRRHGPGSYVAYLDGSVEIASWQKDYEGFEALRLWASNNGGIWARLAPDFQLGTRLYGWIDQPR